MGANDIMSFVSGLLVMIADLTAFALIMRVYLKRRRRSALFFSVAWIADFTMVALSASENRILLAIAELSLTVFAMFMFIGSVKLLEEESIPLSHSTLKKMALMAPVFYVFVVSVYEFTGDANWALTAGVSLGVSGLLVSASGVLLKPIEAVYKKPAKILYLSVILFGLHL
ncbi:MAG: hypothetical protein ABGW50_03975, partial [Thermococcus sp.]